MFASLNHHDRRYDAAAERKEEQEERTRALYAAARRKHEEEERGVVVGRSLMEEKDWAGQSVQRTRRRRLTGKDREKDESVSSLIHKTSSTILSSETQLGRKRFDMNEKSAYRTDLRGDIVGPGGRSLHDASTWITSNQRNANGQKADIHVKSSKRKQLSVEMPGRRRRLPAVSRTTTSTLLNDTVLDRVVSSVGRYHEGRRHRNDIRDKPLPGYTGRAKVISTRRHHDKTVDVNYHPNGAKYSGRR